MNTELEMNLDYATSLIKTDLIETADSYKTSGWWYANHDDKSKYYIYFPNKEYILNRIDEAIKSIDSQEWKKQIVQRSSEYFEEITHEILEGYADKRIRAIKCDANTSYDDGYISTDTFMYIVYDENETTEEVAARLFLKALDYIRRQYEKELELTL